MSGAQDLAGVDRAPSRSGVRRVDPRRPAVMGANGIRRILPDADAVAHARPEAAAAVRVPVVESGPRLRTTEAPKRCFMAVVHGERGLLDRHAQQTIAAAALLADATTAVIAVVLGDVEEDLARLGADQFVVLPDCEARAFQPDREMAHLDALISRFRPAHLFLPDSEEGCGDLGRRLAAARGMSIAAAVVEINARTLTCYRDGRTQFAERVWTDIVLLALDVADARLPWVGHGERVDVVGKPFATRCETTSSPSRTSATSPASASIRDLGCASLASSDLSLQEADFIVAAGHGVRDISLLRQLADRLGAALGASRMVVDDGRVPRTRQIGATGSTVAAGLYIAFGISGAVQHLQGIKDCRRVVAVNLDASAPMVKRSDLSVIGDADAIARALLRLVESPG